MKSKKGSIIVVAMWSLFLLTFFAVTMALGVKSRITFAGRIANRNELRYIAEAGIENVISILNNNLKKVSDSNVNIFSIPAADVRIGLGAFSIDYGFFNGEKEIRIRGIMDEESKININYADYETIGELIRLAADIDKKQADDIAAAIIDWTDEDDFPQINGAESRYYTNINNPYNPKNNEFEELEEIMLIKDMTPEIYKKIEQFITVYGEGRLNINTAEKTVLIAHGMNAALAEKIIAFRKGVDGLSGTDDDSCFKSEQSIVPSLSQACSLSMEEVAVLSNLASDNVFCVNSNNFRIRSTAKIGNNKSRFDIVCVYDRSKMNSGLNAIKYWKETYYVAPGKPS